MSETENLLFCHLADQEPKNEFAQRSSESDTPSHIRATRCASPSNSSFGQICSQRNSNVILLISCFWRSNLVVRRLKRVLHVLFEPKRSSLEAVSGAGQRVSDPRFFIAIAVQMILNGERAATPLKAFRLA